MASIILEHESGNIPIHIISSLVRKSTSLRIEHDGRVELRTPLYLNQGDIQKFIAKKSAWIVKKVSFLSRSQITPMSAEIYSTGNEEKFYYLGKLYTLNLVLAPKNRFSLIEDRITIYHRSNQSVKKFLNQWLEIQANKLFKSRLNLCFALFSQEYSYPLPSLKIRRMRSRWGSMSSKGIMTLNLHLIHLSIESIDYVIMHELCHLKFFNHSKNFYLIQQKLSPDWLNLKLYLDNFISFIRNYP